MDPVITLRKTYGVFKAEVRVRVEFRLIYLCNFSKATKKINNNINLLVWVITSLSKSDDSLIILSKLVYISGNLAITTS